MELPDTESPFMEVHTIASLAREIKRDQTIVRLLLKDNKIELMCSRFSKWSNCFVISNHEANRLRAFYARDLRDIRREMRNKS